MIRIVMTGLDVDGNAVLYTSRVLGCEDCHEMAGMRY
jgi:hypothetical protein